MAHTLTTLRAATELREAPGPGKPFTCLFAPLTLRDRGLELEADDVRQIVANWEAHDGPGRVPIQCDHMGGPAAGWIANLEAVRAGDRTELRVTPEWTDAGRELVASGGYRYCSVGMQQDGRTTNDALIPGYRLRELSLTNVPAVADLPAITLSRGPMDTTTSTDATRLALLGGRVTLTTSAAGPAPDDEEPADVVELFHGACERVRRAERCSAREAMQRAAAKWPRLWTAYLNRRDPRRCFLGLVEHRASTAKVDLATAYRWAAKCEPTKAVVVDTYLSAR